MNNAIDLAEAVINGTTSTHYTAKSIEELKPVYEDIKARYASATTQDEIDALADELNEALRKLVALTAPTIATPTLNGTHTQLKDVYIDAGRMTLSVKAKGISADEYIKMLKFDIEGEYDSFEVIPEMTATGLIYTGAKVTVVATNKAGTTTVEYIVVVKGDSNCNGQVDIGDVVLASKHLGKDELLDGIEAEAMMLNDNDRIDIGDMVLLSGVIGER